MLLTKHTCTQHILLMQPIKALTMAPSYPSLRHPLIQTGCCVAYTRFKIDQMPSEATRYSQLALPSEQASNDQLFSGSLLPSFMLSISPLPSAPLMLLRFPRCRGGRSQDRFLHHGSDHSKVEYPIQSSTSPVPYRRSKNGSTGLYCLPPPSTAPIMLQKAAFTNPGN